MEHSKLVLHVRTVRCGYNKSSSAIASMWLDAIMIMMMQSLPDRVLLLFIIYILMFMGVVNINTYEIL